MNAVFLALALAIQGVPPQDADTSAVLTSQISQRETPTHIYTFLGLTRVENPPKRYRNLHTEVAACLGVIGDYDHILWRIALSGSGESKEDGEVTTLWGLVSIFPEKAIDPKSELEESAAVITLFGVNGQQDPVIRHEIIHWLLWRYTGNSDGDHKSLWWGRCEGP